MFTSIVGAGYGHSLRGRPGMRVNHHHNLGDRRMGHIRLCMVYPERGRWKNFLSSIRFCNPSSCIRRYRHMVVSHRISAQVRKLVMQGRRQGFGSQGGQALVAAERADQADQDRRPSGAARAAIDRSVVRGVDSSTVVPRSVGSYRPVIAGAKLREGTTTILPRGGERSRESACLQCAFTPLAGDPKTTKTDK